MKQLLATLVLALGAATSPNSAQALEAQPRWLCGLEFEGEARGIQILVGSFRSEATGVLHCTSTEGEEYERDVRVTMQTEPIGPTIGLGSFRFVGGAANISVPTSSPRALFGRYVVAQGRAAVIGGAGAFTAFHTSNRSLALNVSLQLVSGFGVEAGFTTMTLRPM